MRPASPVESEASMAIREKLAARGVRLDERLLGRGSYSTVFLGFSAAFGTVAVKKIDRRPRTDYVRKFLPRELQLVLQLDHPNVLRVFQLVRTRDHVCMVEEFAAGGDLLQLIKRRKQIDEPTARPLFRHLIAGLEKEERLQAYAAYEITTSRPYDDNAVDCWSAGVVLYVMLTGFMPFDDRRPKELPIVQKNRRLRFHEGACSADARALIREMLHPNPAVRFRLPQILASRWLRDTPYVINGPPEQEEEMDDEGVSCSTASEIPAQLLDGR
ncbi:Protein kinase domain-containing protein [Aphelenchoides fujianensis]|nr:Protein kinase domain-containing protein [Aphelenchoides fujianensis]